MNLSGLVTFNNAQSGTYYVMVKHRNCIETWSKSGGESYIRGSAFNYNFTSSVTQAYADNLILKGTKYCIFSGDVNQEGLIDVTDIITIYNDASNFVSRYVSTDVTGDNFVDVSDVVIAYNNSSNFVSVRNPIVGDSGLYGLTKKRSF